MLSFSQKKSLLRLARDAIAASLQDEAITSESLENVPVLSHSFAGVFVSLHVERKLRGCIGHLGVTTPLPELIVEMARAAAKHDPRFAPLHPEEFPRVSIEISLLFSMERLGSADDFVIGQHGLMVRLGKHHGLLLPQVAAQRNWDTLTFLQHTCRKADLPVDAWKAAEAEVFRFRAEVFSDHSLN